MLYEDGRAPLTLSTCSKTRSAGPESAHRWSQGAGWRPRCVASSLASRRVGRKLKDTWPSFSHPHMAQSAHAQAAEGEASWTRPVSAPTPASLPCTWAWALRMTSLRSSWAPALDHPVPSRAQCASTALWARPSVQLGGNRHLQAQPTWRLCPLQVLPGRFPDQSGLALSTGLSTRAWEER